MKRFEDYLADPNWTSISIEDGARLLRLPSTSLMPIRAKALFDEHTGHLKEVRGYVPISCGRFRPARMRVLKGSWKLTYEPSVLARDIPA